MGWLDRLFPTRAQALIVLWETKVRPDLVADVEKWPNETPVDKENRALLTAFLDRVEARIVALAVYDSVAPPPHVDKKPEKFATRS